MNLDVTQLTFFQNADSYFFSREQERRCVLSPQPLCSLGFLTLVVCHFFPAWSHNLILLCACQNVLMVTRLSHTLFYCLVYHKDVLGVQGKFMEMTSFPFADD